MNLELNDEAIVTDANSGSEQEGSFTDDDELLLGALTATDEGEEESDSLPADDLIDVNIDGEIKKVSKKDLIAHYQKQGAADKRLQEASELKREVEGHRARYLEHQQKLAESIEQINQHIQLWMSESQPDWNALLEENPHEYLKQQEKYKARLQTLQQAQAAQAYLQQQQQEEYVNELTRVINEEKAKLPEIIPEWKDKKVKEREEQELVNYLGTLGYSHDDIVGLSYSRAANIAIARKAMLYDRAVSKAKGLKKNTGAAMAVPTLGTKSHAQGKRSIDDPNLSPEEFAKLRREQINKRR